MKTVLITGATSGFGLATAKILAEQNFKLVLIGRREERLEELKSSLKTDVYTKVVDVTDKDQVRALFSGLPNEFKKIDVVINSAGLALGINPMPDVKVDDWDQMIATNINGLLYITLEAVKQMKTAGGGLIINIGSVAATVPYKGGNVYGATKAFVRQFSRNLRTDLFATGVKVTNIEPGAAETEFSLVRFKDQNKADEYYKDWRPLKAEDIAATINWVIAQPAHVNIENIEVMPLDQVYAGMIFDKKS